MDATERSKLRGLSVCTMRPLSYEKWFVHEMVGKPPEYELSAKQRQMLDVIYWWYREQINALIACGREFITPTAPEPALDDGIEVRISVEVVADLREMATMNEALDKLEKWNKAVGG